MDMLRTPDERFAGVPDFPFAPQLAEVIVDFVRTTPDGSRQGVVVVPVLPKRFQQSAAALHALSALASSRSARASASRASSFAAFQVLNAESSADAAACSADCSSASVTDVILQGSQDRYDFAFKQLTHLSSVSQGRELRR